MKIETGDKVEFEYIGKFEDGEIFDTSREGVAKEAGIYLEERRYEPLCVDVGKHQIIPGLEEALVGMGKDDKKEVMIPAEKAYGERFEEKVQSIPLNVIQQFNLELKEGMMIGTTQGTAIIKKVTDEFVAMDFNHPLAGKTLIFDVTIVKIEKAS